MRRTRTADEWARESGRPVLWCDCGDRCGDMDVRYDRPGAVCKALPGYETRAKLATPKEDKR